MPGGAGATFLGLSNQEENRKKIQAEVEAGTYIPPTRKQFGADIANTSIDIARKIAGVTLPGFGITSAVAAPVPAKVPVKVEAPPSDITSTEAGKAPPASKPHPAAGTKDIWDYASKLSPEKLKEFVDKNQDNPNLTGVGYVETKDPATGKMRIVPTISRPETPGINAEQLTAMGHYQQGLGLVANAREAMEIRRAEVAEKARATDMKNPLNYMKIVKDFSPVEDVDEIKDGKMVTSKRSNIEEGMRLVKAAGFDPPAGIKTPTITPSPKIPAGAKTGVYKGKRAYQLNNKFYDLESGVEIK